MKVTLFLSSLWLFIASFFAPVAPTVSTVLTGNVTDGHEALIGVVVKVMRGADFVRGTITDFNGDYRIELEPGTYDVEYSYTGFKPERISGVKVLANNYTIQNVVLSSGSQLDEVLISDYKVPLIKQDNTSSGQTLTEDQIKALPKRNVKTIVATTVGASSVDGGAVNIKGARTNGTDTYIDGIRISGGVPPVQDVEQLKIITEGIGAELPVSGTVMIIKDAPKPDLKGGEIDIKGARIENPDIYIDGPRIKGVPLPPLEDLELRTIESGRVLEAEEEVSSPGTPAQPAPRAGLLTAGEWNDLQNWDRHWEDLLADGETDAYQKMYGFFPRQRYTVMLTNENDFPVADAVVKLKTADKIIWEARTDNTGKAELWAALFTAEKETAKLHAEIWVNEKKYEIKALKSVAAGYNLLKVNAECKAPKNVDILWAVDATGSMGDEIEYLKTELLDVIGRAKSRNPELAYRMGTVFYRDHGDEYLTRTSPLSADMLQTVGFIQNQFAGGGGDYPEAVHSALEDAIFKQQWSENAVARICFLVLDASPHQSPEVIASLQKSICEAARLGIRIVPITASGIQKDTEFLMKFFGLATNGSYVFLTDHSGVGGKHLEPTTDEYKVEPLNNLLVRLITEYSSIQTCEGKSEIRFENDPQQQPGPVMQAQYYPNPAVDQFTLELPFEVQSVTIYNSEGLAVRKIEKPVAGANVVLIQDLPAGFYTIRILNNGWMQSGKLMVVRS